MSNQFSTLKTSELVISIELSCSEGIARELIGGRTNSLRVKTELKYLLKRLALIDGSATGSSSWRVG